MNIANRISFVASDPQRQVIPWVRAQDRQGHITVHVAKDSKLTPGRIRNSSKHLMDCIDCHDRPSHIFTPPDQAVDSALLARRLDPQMPFIKQQAVHALSATYADDNAAMIGIVKSLSDLFVQISTAVCRGKPSVGECACGSTAHLCRNNLPLYEGRLAHASEQCRPLLRAGMLPLSRWTACECGWKSHSKGLRLVPFGHCSSGIGKTGHINYAKAAIRSPGRYWRPEGRNLQRLPYGR